MPNGSTTLRMISFFHQKVAASSPTSAACELEEPLANFFASGIPGPETKARPHSLAIPAQFFARYRSFESSSSSSPARQRRPPNWPKAMANGSRNPACTPKPTRTAPSAMPSSSAIPRSWSPASSAFATSQGRHWFSPTPPAILPYTRGHHRRLPLPPPSRCRRTLCQRLHRPALDRWANRLRPWPTAQNPPTPNNLLPPPRKRQIPRRLHLLRQRHQGPWRAVFDARKLAGKLRK